VRGDRLKCGDDRLNNSVRVAKHVIVPKAKHEVAPPFQISCAPRILFATNCMLTAIDFDDEPRCLTAKIDDVAANRHLPTKFKSIHPTIAQPKPQHALSVGLIASKFPGCVNTRYHNPSPALASLGHPLPLGEGNEWHRRDFSPFV